MIKKFKILGFMALMCSAGLTHANPLVSIDIGHHKKSQGTVSSYGDYEFNYNKEMAQYVAKSFTNQGYNVNLIGFNGDAKDLVQRARLADNSSMFVSIHHDALQSQDLNTWKYNNKKLPFNDEVGGFGVFVSTKNPQFEKSLMCAKLVAEKLMQAGFTPNYYHNKDIKGEQKHLFFNNLPVYKYDNLIVLKTTTVPAMLIEAGVLTNRKEAKWIAQQNVREAFATSVSEAVHQCLNKPKMKR